MVSCRRCRHARPPSVRPPCPSRPPDAAETKVGAPVSQVQVTSASRTASSRTCASTPALFRLANRTSPPLAPTSSVSPGARACLTQGRGGQRRGWAKELCSTKRPPIGVRPLCSQTERAFPKTTLARRMRAFRVLCFSGAASHVLGTFQLRAFDCNWNAFQSRLIFIRANAHCN